MVLLLFLGFKLGPAGVFGAGGAAGAVSFFLGAFLDIGAAGEVGAAGAAGATAGNLAGATFLGLGSGRLDVGAFIGAAGLPGTSLEHGAAVGAGEGALGVFWSLLAASEVLKKSSCPSCRSKSFLGAGWDHRVG